MITLSDGTTTIELPPDLAWSDEHAWSAVERSETRGLTGAMILQVALRQAGRPITLVPPDNGGWWPRSSWTQIQTWLDVPEIVLTLTLRGVPYSVTWRATGGDRPAAEATPLIHYSDPDPTSWIRPSFNFITV